MELPELNLKVLLELTLPEILRFCQTSKEYQSLCDNEHFWKQILERDYPGASQFKTPGVSYREMYFGFYDAHLPPPALAQYIPKRPRRIAIHKDYLYVLKWLSLIDPLDNSDVTSAIQSNSYKILEWFLESGIRPDKYMVNIATHNCQLSIPNLLEKYGLLPEQSALNVAARRNCIDILDWLYQRGFVPNERTLKEALKGGSMRALGWLWSHGVKPDIDDAEELTEAAVDTNQLESLKWLYGLGISPNEVDLAMAAHSDDLKIVKWMSQLDTPLLPNTELANELAQGGNVEILDWMSHLNPPVLPTQEGIDLAAMVGHVDILEWAFNLPSPILPTHLDNSDEDVKEWAESVRRRVTDLLKRVNSWE